MAKINLLPWREQRRKERQKQFLTQLGAIALAGIVAIVATHMFINGQTNAHKKRNNLLKTEIKLMDQRIQEIKDIDSLKKALVDRMGVIQRLQESRPEVVHFFDQMVTTLPEGLLLTHIKQRNNILSIDGKAESNARVSTYMRNLNNSPWLDNAKLLFIEAKESNSSTRHIRSFALQVTQVNPHSQESEGEK